MGVARWRHKNQINVCVNKQFRSSLKNVRVYRGADISSDHYLCVAILQLKLKRKVAQPPQKKPNLSRLKDEATKDKFNLELKHRLTGLENLFDNQEDAWIHIKTSYNTVATEVLGHAHKPSEEWITEDTWEEIELRKECKKRLLQEKHQEKNQDLQDEYRKRDNAYI